MTTENRDMAIDKYPTPMLDQLETGPWPSFITGIKRMPCRFTPGGSC